MPKEKKRPSVPRTGVGKSDPGESGRANEGDDGASSGQGRVCGKCGQVHRRCSGHTRHGPNAGKPCGANPPRGSRLCIKHGGNRPEIRKAAKQRLLELVDPALAALHKVLTNPEAEDSTKVRAAVAILDRTGFKPGLVVEVEPGDKWSALLDGATMVDNRALGGGGAAAELANEAALQLALDARDQAWRAYDAEDAEEYASRPSFRDENTVSGVVVGRYDVPRDQPPNAPPRYASEGER
jgi:hypothetical protein